MTKTIKQLAVGVLLAALILSLSVFIPNYYGTHADAAEHSLQAESADFEGIGYAFSSSTAAAGGMSYSLSAGLDLTGKTGLAIRIKNLTNAVYQYNQFRIYLDNNEVYSPYGATVKFYGADGSIQTTSHTARLVNVPASFDGYMLLPFDQTVRICNSSGSWYWTENSANHLTESDGSFLTAKWTKLGFYSLANTPEKEVIFGAHYAYTETDGTVTLSSEATIVASSFAKPSNNEPLMNTRQIPVPPKPTTIEITQNDFAENGYGIRVKENAMSGIQWSLTENLPLEGQTGIAIRIKNTSGNRATMQQLRLYVANSSLIYSNYSSKINFFSIDGSQTTVEGSARNAYIPAGFDGYMLVPYTELIVIGKSAGGWIWNDNVKLNAEAEDDHALPTGEVNKMVYYMPANSVGQELLIGRIATYAEGEAVTLLGETYIDGDTLATPSEAAMESYSVPAASSFEIKIDGVKGVKNDALDTGAEEDTFTLDYGYSFSFDPVAALGYAVASVELIDGENISVIEGNSFVNKLPYGNYAINFRTAETLNFRATGIDDGDISDKLYISASVDNSDGKALDYFITITDGVKQYRADKGAGIYEDEDGLKYYGNVFSVPAGYKGKIYIPFNVWRGSVYGAAQNLPWDYAEGGKPVTVTDRIYLVCSSGRSDEDLAEVFGGWQYVSEAQQITKADLSNANLYVEGDADLVGGVLADTAETAAANTAGQAKAISVSVSGAQSFDVAGLAVRVKNISGADYGIRLYVVTADGKTFVGQQKYYYALIYADGTVVTYTDNNRNIIVPVDFDGTIIADFAEFATDNGSSLTENVNRREKTVAKINMYSAGTKGTGIMFGKAAWIGYRGIIDGEFTVSAANASNNTGISDNWFTFGEVKATPVVCENEDITLSENFAIYGTTEIFVNAKEGKLITSISGEGIAFAAAENGYTATIEYVYTDAAEIFVINAVTANAATVTVNAGENGAVTYGGAAAGGTITVEEGVSFEIEVTPNIGFEATVTADGAVVSGTEGVYVIPAGTEVISVEFNALTAQLTVSVSGNGVLYIEGEATVDGVYSVEQGRNITLAVTPENGYVATVRLNGEDVLADDGNYSVLLTSDSVLSVTFEPEVYSITYDLDRGENGNNPSVYTVNDSFVFAAATKEGYDFLYWYVISDGEERQVTGISEGSTGDVKVYAKFRLVAEDSEESSSGVSAEKTKGCFSSAGGGFALGAVILLAVATIVKKKKN